MTTSGENTVAESVSPELGSAGSLPAPFSGEQLATQIAALANQLFAGQGSQAPGATTDPQSIAPNRLPSNPNELAAALPIDTPQSPRSSLVFPLVPPNHGGALPSPGFTSDASLPPVPGPLQGPPLAVSPAPKESDLRSGATQAAAQLSPSSPTFQNPDARASSSASESSTPYFLGLAGFPATSAPAVSIPANTSIPPTSAPQSSIAPEQGSGLTPQAASLPFELSAFTPSLSEAPSVLTQPSASRGIFDAYAIKSDFPILQERVHNKPLVWLDNAATTQKPQAVIDRLSYFYEHENSNIHRAAHALAARATDAYESAREKVRGFLGAPSIENIIFVRGATEGVNLVAQSWGRRHVTHGDEIVVSWLEHHANIVPWQQLCAEKGAVLRVAPVDGTGQIILEEYEKLLGPRTRLVSITQVSNALGTITPAKEMIEIAHRYGVTVLLDGAQAVSHMPVDVQALDCDFYVFSGHKVFAPTGIGVVYGKSAVLDTMPPWQGGGNMIADVTFEKTIYQRPPARFEAGTGNIADAVGLGAAIDYVSTLGMANIARYEHELLEYATGCLKEVPGLKLIGTAKEKAGVLSFVLDTWRTEDIGAALDREGIAVRSGHHCAQPILRRFGLEATVRASLAPYNTFEDIDALTKALLRLAAERRR